MSPSRLHDDLSEILSEIVDLAADAFGRTSKSLRMTRLRPRGDPPGTGLEPDCSFYVGERAERYRLCPEGRRSCRRRLLGGAGPGPRRRGRGHPRGQGQGRPLRGPRSAGVLADPGAAGRSGGGGGPLRPATGRAAPDARGFGGVARAHPRRRPRSDRAGPVQSHRHRAHAGGGPNRRRRREASMRVREEDPPPYSAIRQQSEGAPACPHR